MNIGSSLQPVARPVRDEVLVVELDRALALDDRAWSVRAPS